MHPGLLFQGPLKECWIYTLTSQFSKSRVRWEYLTFSLWLRPCVRFPFVLLWSRVHQSTLGLPATDLHGGFLLSQRILELKQILEVIYFNSFLVQIGNGGSKSWVICPRSYNRVKYYQNPDLLVSCPGLTSCGFLKVLYELLELIFFFFFPRTFCRGGLMESRPQGRFSKVLPQWDWRNNWGRVFMSDNMACISKSLKGIGRIWYFTRPETGVLFVHRIFSEKAIVHAEREEKIIKF